MNTLFVTGGRGDSEMPLAPGGKRAMVPAVEVDTYICPGCGAELKVGSHGCARCSARKKRRKAAVQAWDQSSAYDGLDLPGEDFDSEDFAAREPEFGEEEAPHRQTGLRWYWWLTAVLVLIATVLTMWL